MEEKKQSIWGIVFRIVLILALVGLIFYFAGVGQNKAKFIQYSEFYAEMDKVNSEDPAVEQLYLKVFVDGTTIKILKKGSTINGESFPAKFDVYTSHTSYDAVNTLLEKYKTKFGANFEFSTQGQTTSWFESLLPYILIIGSSVLMFWFVFRALNKSNNGAMSFGKSRAKLGNNSKVTFADVAGAEEEKAELKEIVEFLKDPQKFIKLGARIPKGFLMVGPPGTGKTLLARAVAGESNVPFFSITGSDFVEMFVGVGASRVRDLFEQAKHATPCIVFIDEIDAVGRQRGAGLGGGNDEREQTLNQLLTQMDGFEANSGIVVMAATNRADVLDPALTRPGRFDRQIYVYPPDVKGREAILKVHAKNKPLDPSVNLEDLARLTTGFTGADIELLLNEAAIFAARENKQIISMQDLLNAVNKVIMGPEKKSRVMSERDKKITAYHEAGHAIVGKILLKDSDEVQEVSIIPRGASGGHTLHRPATDNIYETKGHILADIAMCYGGRAAEELIFEDISTGAVGDIQIATKQATAMVTKYGMSELGPINYHDDDELFLGRDYMSKSAVSENMAAKIDSEVSKILTNGMKQAKEILLKNKKLMDEMVKLLLVRETILTDEVNMIMEGKTSEEILKYVEKREKEKETKRAEESKLAEKFNKEKKEKENREKAMQAVEFLNASGILTASMLDEEKEPNTQDTQKVESKADKTDKNDSKIETKIVAKTDNQTKIDTDKTISTTNKKTNITKNVKQKEETKNKDKEDNK